MGKSSKAYKGKHITRQEGQQLVHLTLLLPVLLAFLGLVVDGGNVYVHHRLAQDAADAAASAAGIALYHNGRSAAISTAYYYAAQYGYDNNGTTNIVLVTTPPSCGAYTSNSHYIRVQIQDNVSPIFAATVWNGTFRIRAYATAGYTMAALKSPVIVLAKHGRGTLEMSGLTLLRVTTGNIHVNSDHPEAVRLTGISSIITVDPMTIVGGYRINGWTFINPEPIIGPPIPIEPPIPIGPPTPIKPQPIIRVPLPTISKPIFKPGFWSHSGPKSIFEPGFWSHSEPESILETGPTSKTGPESITSTDPAARVGPEPNFGPNSSDRIGPGPRPIIGPPIFIRPKPITGAPVLPDPLAGLPAPNFEAYPVRHGTPAHPRTLHINGFARVTLNPGIYYGGISISGIANVTFSPGIYIMAGGGLKVSGSCRVRGSGVFFYISKDPHHSYGHGHMGSIDINGNTRIRLTPPTSGTYASILFFQDRKDQKKAKITGISALNGLKGIIYLPAAELDLNGSANSHINLVVNKLRLSGRSTLIVDGYQGPGWTTVTFALTE